MQPSPQAEQPGYAGEPQAPDSAPTHVHPTLTTAVGHTCANCGSELAPEQRYCLECGERRGPSGLAAFERQAQSTVVAPPAAPARRVLGRSLPLSPFSANSALIAGVGTLLLALGVGVLIGRSGQSSSSKPAPVQVVSVPGSAGVASAPSSTSAATPAAGTGSSARKSKTAASASVPAVSSGAVVRPTKSAPPPTKVVTVGSPGSGPGYSHGHFTGNFFGGG